MHNTAFFLLGVAALVSFSCSSVDGHEHGSAKASPLTIAPCDQSFPIDAARSLAVTDPVVLAKFSFARVMDAIRVSANVSPAETSLGIYQRWMRTFDATSAKGDCNDPSIDPNDYGLVCPRLAEADFAKLDPFAESSESRFVPVALFNRFDLAPSNGSTCGEYRIVYAMSPVRTIPGRAFLIFEAALPNPRPDLGLAACAPVAQMWRGLSGDPDAASRAAKLEQFYFAGLDGFEPVVSATHYGLPFGSPSRAIGQVRTNFFAFFQEWQLREFKLKRSCTSTACTLAFSHVTVKNNPAEELFSGAHSKAGTFRSHFVGQVRGLAGPTLTSISMRTGNGFNEFESVSQRNDVAYSLVANEPIRSAVATKLTSLKSSLTPNEIFDRATTQTCAGCHQVSNGAPLGGGLQWPQSLGFVHVDEGGALSPALTEVFLPHRAAVLHSFVQQSCAGVTGQDLPAPGTTLGGAAEGSPN